MRSNCSEQQKKVTKKALTEKPRTTIRMKFDSAEKHKTTIRIKIDPAEKTKKPIRMKIDPAEKNKENHPDENCSG